MNNSINNNIKKNKILEINLTQEIKNVSLKLQDTVERNYRFRYMQRHPMFLSRKT